MNLFEFRLLMENTVQEPILNSMDCDDNKQEKKQIVRDPAFLFKDNKQLIILLFQYHFYRANDFPLAIYYERISTYNFKKITFQVLHAIIDNYQIIHKTITKNMHTWEFSRLGNIEKALLSFGCYYLLFEKEINKEVIIYFCIKHAHLYCDKKAYRLINKVLDNIAKWLNN